ncbi:Transposable element tcb1 transposase [Caligus rogercresseyi]|uniref:Transposable element tcb1 transposase n=1 Tax=Caligus rogercresseyi TaxID=217165 RepID=A0A7T8JZP3_CALRO|nr:Transposable element tcb1 transposase [Caligus rogercresseyi]
MGAIRTDEFVAEVKRKVNEDGNKSYAKLVAEMGCSKQTIANTINKDMGYSSYKKRHRMILTEGTRESRRVKAAALLNNLKHERAGLLSQDQNSNRQNDRWICQNVDEVPVVKHTKFPSSVMVLGVISSEEDVMPPPPLIREGPQGQHGHLHRRYEERREALDGPGGEWEALCLPVGLCSRPQVEGDPVVAVGEPPLPLEPELVAPQLPDCNPSTIFWGMVENKTNKHAHNTLDSLRAAIVEGFANMKKDVVAKACSRFRHRLEMVVNADGGYIEK